VTDQTVTVAWNGKRYLARVNPLYDVALIVGPAIAEKNEQEEQEGEKTMTNEERLLALEQKVAKLESVCALQQGGLEKLGVVVDGDQRVFEAQTGYVAQDPRKATEN
jgi:hypothetical protein